MKKLHILLTCLGFLWAVTYIYVETELNPASLYLLAAEWGSLLLIFSGFLYAKVSQKKESKGAIIFWVVYTTLSTGYFIVYKGIERYNRNFCHNKFGMEFNTRRQILGIPIIPTNWRIKYPSSESSEWQPKDSVFGHESKYVSIDAACTIGFEEDEYIFKPLNRKPRLLRIHFEYARGNAKDSIFFYFNGGDSTRTISSQQADSIFAAERIKKDY